jgi:hypothetical protein
LAGLAGARHLVLCVEPDLPVLTNAVVPPLLGIVQRRTVDGIVAAAGSFDTFTLVLGADAGIPPLLLGRLRAAAGEVRTVATAEVGDAAVPATGVTVLGPDAATPAARALTITGRLGRRALAPLPAPVRNAGLAAARTGVHALRAVRDR